MVGVFTREQLVEQGIVKFLMRLQRLAYLDFAVEWHSHGKCCGEQQDFYLTEVFCDFKIK